jgi:hypothetical protein
MVEFALLAPVFFILVFGIIEGGLFLYVDNTASYSVGRALLRVAAEGNTQGGAYADPDADALAELRHAGIGNTALASVSSVRIFAASFDPVSNSYQPYSAGCGGGPCQCIYRMDGTRISCNWDPTTRDTSRSSKVVVGMELSFAYHPFTGVMGNVSMTQTKYLRFEPTSNT